MPLPPKCEVNLSLENSYQNAIHFYWQPNYYAPFVAEETKVQSLARSRGGIQAQVFGFKAVFFPFII